MKCLICKQKCWSQHPFYYCKPCEQPYSKYKLLWGEYEFEQYDYRFGQRYKDFTKSVFDCIKEKPRTHGELAKMFFQHRWLSDALDDLVASILVKSSGVIITRYEIQNN